MRVANRVSGEAQMSRKDRKSLLERRSEFLGGIIALIVYGTVHGFVSDTRGLWFCVVWFFAIICGASVGLTYLTVKTWWYHERI